MGSHLVDGQFQSDKYPTCPRGKVPLSVKDPAAQDLLWEYAQRCREVDAEFAADLEQALESAYYQTWDYYPTWRRWLEMGEHHMAVNCKRVAESWGEPRPRSLAASFMRWLAGEEVLGNGPMAKRRPGSTFSIIIGHVEFVRDSLHSLGDMLRHVGYTEAETDALVSAFKAMFAQVPMYVPEDVACMHSSAIFSTIYSRKTVSDAELRQVVAAQVGAHFDEAHYAAALEDLEGRCVRRNERGDWSYLERERESE